MASPFGPDLSSAMSAGIQNAAGITQLRSMKADQQRQDVLRANTPLALEGDQNALRSITSADPDSGMKIQQFLQTADKAKIERVLQSADIMGRMAPMIANAPDGEIVDAYAWGLDNAKKAGIDISTAPRTSDPAQIRTYMKFLQSQALSVKDQMPKLDTIYDSSGRSQKAMVNPMTGDIVRNVGGPKAESGTSLTVDPETGAVSFYQGVGAPKGAMSPLGPKGRNDTEANLINSTEALARLNQIGELYKPEFSTLQGQGNAAWLGVKAKAGGALGDLSSDQEQYLTDFADYRSTSIDNVNKLLKEMSGAAITPQEAERLRASLPDPGTGVFDGDNPVSFKSKMDARSRDIKLAVARQTYHRSRGLSGNPWDTISLTEMPQVMGKREGELTKEVQSANPDADKAAVRAQVRNLMKQEFGL